MAAWRTAHGQHSEVGWHSQLSALSLLQCMHLLTRECERYAKRMMPQTCSSCRFGALTWVRLSRAWIGGERFRSNMTHILRTVAVTVSLPWAKHGRNWHEYKTEIGNLWSCGPRMARSLCRASSDMLYLNTLGSQLFLCHKCQIFLCLILFAAFGQLEFGWFLLLFSS